MNALLILAASFLAAPDDAMEKELAKFQGAWELSAGEVDGKAIKAEHIEDSSLAWKGAEVTLTTPHLSPEKIRSRVTRIDPAKKEIEWVRENGPHKGVKVVALYEFPDGDNFKVCFHPAGKPKPSKLDSEEGDGYIFHTFKRAKK